MTSPESMDMYKYFDELASQGIEVTLRMNYVFENELRIEVKSNGNKLSTSIDGTANINPKMIIEKVKSAVKFLDLLDEEE